MPIPDLAALEVMGQVQAEVLSLSLSSGGIELTGPCGAAPWYIQVAADDDPLGLATAMVVRNLGQPLIVHSTSWRRDRGSVLLTFVAVLDHSLVAALQSVPVRRVGLARGSAVAAPASVTVDQVIEHGLRHLAWLTLDDAVVARQLGDGWAEVLGGYHPAPFQALG